MTMQDGLPDTAAARAEVLQRVRTALSTKEAHHPRADHPQARPSGIRPPSTRADVLDLLVERVGDYRATVERCAAGNVADVVAAALMGCESVVVPMGLDTECLSAAAQRQVAEADVQDVHDLEGVDAVVSTATVAIAETGTLVLDHGPGQGRRGLTLLPDRHVCIVHAAQVVTTVPEAFAILRPCIDARRALTWVSGPSATSDIELDRVEGVHGPRTLHVVLVEDDPRPDGVAEEAG